MSRTALASLAAAAAVLVAAAPAGAEVSGLRAKATVLKITSLGPRVAGSPTEWRAGRIVAERLRAFGYEVVVQRVRLPNGDLSRNVVGRSPGPLRARSSSLTSTASAGRWRRTTTPRASR